MGDKPNSPFFKGDKEEEAAPRDEQVEAALDAADKADTAKEAADETLNELFDKTEEDAEAATADPDGTDEALFDEPSKTPKGWTDKTYARFKQVIGQRNDGRKTNAAQTKTISVHEEFQRTISDKYASFDNPAAVAAADADFMNAFEQLAKTTPSIAALADQVKAFQQTGRIPVSDGQPIAPIHTPPVARATETPKQDPQVAKLIEQGARTTINTTMAGLNVKPEFQKIIADSMVASGADLASLDSTAVIAKAKAFITDNGFSAAEVLTQAPDGKAKGKPNTGGRSKPATGQRASGDGESENDTPAAPKNREEWAANREKLMRGIIGSD